MSKKNIFGKISKQTNYDKKIVEYVINSKERGVSDFEIKVSILDLFRNPITEQQVIKIWDIYKWWNRLKEISEIQDLQFQRQQEHKNAFVGSDDEDMTELEKIQHKFAKRWITIKIEYDPKPKYESRALPPFLWWDINNVLVIWDIHEPYSLDDYLYFCRQQQERFNCWSVLVIWDIVDFHSISYHEKIPEELNPAWEIAEARRRLKDWYLTFPTATVTMGNHDSLIRRQLRSAWLLREFVKDPRTIFEAPLWWDFVDEIIVNDVLYTHWNTSDARKKCILEDMNMVSWHAHTKCGIIYHQNRHWKKRGMQVWVGIDYKRQAFEYAKSNGKHPVTACGVVLDMWTLPIIIPFNP